MKIMVIYLLLFFSLPLQANERGDLENEMADILGFKETVDHYFMEYRNQLVKLYPFLTDEYFESNYGSVFQYGKERYMESYMKGLSIYTDEELKKRLEYYNSDEGKWIIKKNLESNKIILDDLTRASGDFNEVFIKKMKSLE
ncbi:hypothetical protein L4C38_17965 [Vibrio kasasachensis]|uniref:hypothetical protein n=1 Tax=Vibrio kasasachensis TaxID=2910248 RepID=UPI003D0EA758